MSGEKFLPNALLSDVDGTLLNSHHEASAETIAALAAMLKLGHRVLLATGKGRGGDWLLKLRQALDLEPASSDPAAPPVLVPQSWTLNAPAIFLQGLLVCGPDGSVLHQETLAPGTVAQLLAFATEQHVDVVLYTTDDRILCREQTRYTDMIVPYGESSPFPVGSAGLEQLAASSPSSVSSVSPSSPPLGVYKVLLITEDEHIPALRAKAAAALGDTAALTQAVPCMLEVLPPLGCKERGLEIALKSLGPDYGPSRAVAMGDGENDIGMLRWVAAHGGRAVAVGNAKDSVKAVAQDIVGSNDEHAVAQVCERYFLTR